MFINWKLREVNLNIVYYGPALSGKTTNLEQIHAHAQPSARSELFVLNTHQDRTIFFDFLQLEMGNIGGLRPKFGLYTVPGQIYYEATRATVLRRADGLVFVADSQVAQLDENRASWQDMRRHLAQMRLNLPLVVQLNKRDMPQVLPVEQLKTALGAAPFPCFEAIAIKGIGVRETLQAIMRLLMLDVQNKLNLQSQNRPQ